MRFDAAHVSDSGDYPFIPFALNGFINHGEKSKLTSLWFLTLPFNYFVI